jgi:hypothetical protein
MKTIQHDLPSRSIRDVSIRFGAFYTANQGEQIRRWE